MSRESYIKGFVKCAKDHGVDPSALISKISHSDDVEKQANWLTDLYTKWRTGVEMKASDKYRIALGLKPFNRSFPVPTPGSYHLNDNSLVQLAQNYSDQYAKGSIAKPKVYSQGRPIAK